MNKRIRFSLLTLLILLCSTVAGAATGYTYDFNTTIATSNHDFVLGSNWGHVVGSGDYDGYGPYYMSYSYTNDGGFGGTGSLIAYRQYAGDNGGGTECYDLLVTPLVSGEITMKVKAHTNASNSNPSFVEIYAIDAAGTTRGSLIQRFTATSGYADIAGQKDWKQISLTLSEEQRIAIRAQYVYLDDFTAASVNIIAQKTLSVVSVMNMEGKEGTQGSTTYFEQQADGTLNVPLKVLLSNTGDVDLIAGTTENYSLTLASASYLSGMKTYYNEATVNVPVNLAAGASETVEVKFSIPYSSGWRYYFIRENISGTTSSSNRYAGVIAYEPKFIFRTAGSTATSSLSGTQAFGLINEATTKRFEIANTGTAPLTIKSITLPEGFTSANMPEIPAEGLAIAKGSAQSLDITLPTTTNGNFAGNLVIVYLDANGAEKTYTLAFTGSVLAAGTWAADFNGKEATVEYPAGSVAESGINSGYQYADGAYNFYLTGRTYSSYANGDNKFITPKLHATAGQHLTFDVKGVSGASYYAKVYVSTDRKTWGDPVAYFTYGEKAGAEAIGSSDWVNKAITFDAEGDYYVAFSLYGEFKIDNLIGLKKVDVAHDLYIKSVNWPDASVKNGTTLQRPSLDVIPLTNETAEAYTVKYLCGETVLAEAASVALTASANSSKTFSFNWTPTVENTTVYENTKVVFDFGGGVTFESDPFTLTVTNEPKFHFVKVLPSSKWSEPSDYTTPITFGKTNETAAQSFYVYNWGSAPLTVKSITVPAGFTVTPTEQFVVAAFNESDMTVAAQAVEIAFSATEAGIYSGDMAITYLNGAGEEQTFTIAVSGTKLDPAKYYANFGGEANQWPAGSVYQKNVSTTYVNTNDYAITSTNTADNIFITPKLTAAAGEKLQFDAKLYSTSWSEGKVVVYAAATREEVLNAEEGTTRQQLFSVSGEDAQNPMTTDYQTFEVTVPEAGDYYFGFEISGRPYVDEIYGLKPAADAHDWAIASSHIPTNGMQNCEFTATVNIQNFGLADEAADSYEMNVYVNDKLMAAGKAVAIPMNHRLEDAGTQLSASVRYPKVGTFPVYIEVKAGDYSVKTAAVDVTFAEEVASSNADMAADGTTADVPLNLNYKNSESVTLYNAEALSSIGLVNGSKICAITFKGYKTSDEQTTSLQVYYKWTDEQTLTQPTAAYPYAAADNGMTKLIDEDHTWIKVGSATEMGDMLELIFSEPLVYEAGKSLCIYMHSYVDGYKATYFEKSTLSSDFCYYRRQDDATITSGWNKAVPAAAHFSLIAESNTISGTVKDQEGTAVAGAAITLVSNDGEGIEYTGTTDAEGAFSINVIQTGRTYNVDVVAEGYEGTSEAGISFAEGNVTKDFVIILPQPIIPEGKYYLMAAAYENPQLLMAAGKNWGTQAIVNEKGLDLNFIYDKTSKTYTIDTDIYNSETSHFLGSNLYMDSPAFDWTVEGEFVYTIGAVIDGKKQYLAVASDSRLYLTEDGTADNAQWAFIKADFWDNLVKEEGLESLKTATKDQPVDATFLLKDAEFNRNDHRWNAWTVSEDCTNKNLGGGCNGNEGNGCAESYHSTFTISQLVQGAPAGYYSVTAQGFYRQDGSDNEHLPVFFANDETQTFPLLTSSENNMTEAGASFAEGKYAIEPILVKVEEDGILNIGVKLEGNTSLWCIWDNFQLTYYGVKNPVVNPDDDESVGIQAVNGQKTGKAIYNLQGQKVEKLQKGINIVNGRKVVRSAK